MLRIWGRATSSNVQKVLWCCDELRLAYDRIDAGREFGQVDGQPYRALNPNGLVPTLIDGDTVVWESNAIMRYLCNRYGGEHLYPTDSAARAGVDQWLDWQLTTLAPAIGPVFWALIRPPAAGPDMAVVAKQVVKLGQVWTLLDAHLAHQHYVAGTVLSIADLAMGNSARRWFAFDLERPDLPNLATWFARLGERPGFRSHIMTPVV
ncbi:MAG: glutathione S-transferase family protein [Aliidongia sp.]